MRFRLISPRPLIVVIALIAAFVGAVPASAGPDAPPVAVIVRAVPGATVPVRRMVEDLGGRVGIDLSIIDGFAASIPGPALGVLVADRRVVSVTPDASVELAGRSDGGAAVGAMAVINSEVIRSDVFWKRGFTGEGIGVALIDSGVTPVGGLDSSDKVLRGPDLSFDGEFDNLRYLDLFGHGTHMAGIIAGRDPSLPDRPGPGDLVGHFAGVAPDAHIVNVKVADATGTADVSQVIAGIQWVVAHQDDPGVNIRVLNLAFGTDSTQDYRIDPLAFATEVAWQAGIVVVVSAGNDGTDRGLRDPATDPYVLAVGAVDANGTYRVNDDKVLAFSNCGTASRAVDVFAPGRSVSSLRVPGSYVDTNYPEGRDGDRFFRGTGTSQATAVVSGAVALLLDQRPELTPDQVKAVLEASARRQPSATGHCAQAGLIDLKQLYSARIPRRSMQSWEQATGTGSIEASRGSYHVYKDGVPLTGEVDVTGGTWSGGTWSGGTWSGGTWSGGTWSGGTWSGGTWSGGTWSGGTWSDATWSGGTWSGGTWSGGTWSGGTWSGGTWSGGTWSDHAWSTVDWG